MELYSMNGISGEELKSNETMEELFSTASLWALAQSDSCGDVETRGGSIAFQTQQTLEPNGIVDPRFPGDSTCDDSDQQRIQAELLQNQRSQLVQNQNLLKRSLEQLRRTSAIGRAKELIKHYQLSARMEMLAEDKQILIQKLEGLKQKLCLLQKERIDLSSTCMRTNSLSSIRRAGRHFRRRSA